MNTQTEATSTGNDRKSVKEEIVRLFDLLDPAQQEEIVQFVADLIASRPSLDLSAPQKRLQEIAEVTGQAAPTVLLDCDGGPSEALLAYCRQVDASLDWIFDGDARALIARAFHRRQIRQRQAARPS